MCEMRKRLEELFKFANSQEMIAKRKAKDLFNTQPRPLEPGELVLCHTPGLTSKLYGIWEGSFEVLAKMSEYNYVISVPSKRYTKQSVHVNSLKNGRNPKLIYLGRWKQMRRRCMSQLIKYGCEPLICPRHSRVN